MSNKRPRPTDDGSDASGAADALNDLDINDNTTRSSGLIDYIFHGTPFDRTKYDR